jgi:hypothetical protein
MRNDTSLMRNRHRNIDMRGRSHIGLEYDGSLLLNSSPLCQIYVAQVDQHYLTVLREQLGIGLPLLEFNSLFSEVGEGGTSGLLHSAPLLLPLDKGFLLLIHLRL